jgi:hypothetical protein
VTGSSAWWIWLRSESSWFNAYASEMV